MNEIISNSFNIIIDKNEIIIPPLSNSKNKKVIKISIYSSDSTPSQVKTGNGDAILDNICIDCITDEVLETGENYLDATFLVDNEGLWKHIQEESVLKVQMDYGEEYYRIAKIKSTSRDITVFARQETIHQTLHMWLSDVRPENQSGQGALTWMKDYSDGPKDITVLSDIPKLSTAYYMDMNLYKAIHDCDQSFINRWGGEIQRRGYTLRINQRIGIHRGLQIRSNKNLTGFEADTNIDNVFTRLKPKGFDGITIDGYVESPIISNYKYKKTKDIKYDDVKVKAENSEEGYETLEEAQAELIRRSELEFSENHIDKIKANYSINFVLLEETEEYKDYVVAERAYIGDEIDVYEETLEIYITVRVTRKRYDVLRQRPIDVELSNEVVRRKPPTIGDIVDKVEDLEDGLNENFENILNQAKDEATNIINNGLKDSYVVVRKNEILIMDTTDINTATNVWRWNRGGLGFSSTGYYGQYGTAITNDGKIVADFITTGVLNAGIIKTGLLKSFNSKTWINMNDGTFNFADYFSFDGKNLDLNGTFKCYKNGANRTGHYLYQSGAMHRGYLEGKNSPTFSSGIWNPDGEGEVGYVSVGLTNSEISDANGCLWMSPLLNGGARLAFTRNYNDVLGVSGIEYDTNGEVRYRCYFQDRMVNGITPHVFDGGIKAYTFKGDFADINGAIAVANTVYSRGENLYFNVGGYDGEYGIRLNSQGYLNPLGRVQLGTNVDYYYKLVALYNNEVVSDRELKEDIEYITDQAPYSLDAKNITYSDMYEFFKSELSLAKYKLKKSSETDIQREQVGFIAQDLQNSKVGSYIVNENESGLLTYDTGNRISILEGALIKSIEKIDFLENEIRLMKEGGIGA